MMVWDRAFLIAVCLFWGFIFVFDNISVCTVLPLGLAEGGTWCSGVSTRGHADARAAALPSAGLAAGDRRPPQPSGGLWPNPASRDLGYMPGTCSTTSRIACGPGWALLSQQLGQRARWQQGAGPWGRGTTGQGRSLPHWDCHEQAWAAPAAGTPEDSNLSQTCVLISVQPIYIHNSCYFFPSYMDASCPRSPLPSPSKPCCFSHACPGWHGASSLWGRARCSPGRHVGAALPPAAPRPRRPLPPAPGQEPPYTARAVRARSLFCQGDLFNHLIFWWPFIPRFHGYSPIKRRSNKAASQTGNKNIKAMCALGGREGEPHAARRDRPCQGGGRGAGACAAW